MKITNDIKALATALLNESNARINNRELRAKMADSICAVFNDTLEGQTVDGHFKNRVQKALREHDGLNWICTVNHDSICVHLTVDVDGVNEDLQFNTYGQENVFKIVSFTELNKVVLNARSRQLQEVSRRNKRELTRDVNRIKKALQKLVDEVDNFKQSYPELEHELHAGNFHKNSDGDSVYMTSFFKDNG